MPIRITLHSTIEYNANGGSGAPANTVYTTLADVGSGMNYVNVPVDYGVPTRSGYTFVNWKYTQYDVIRYATGGSQVQFQYAVGSGIQYDQYKTYTLYAQWKPNTYNVSYNANGGSGAPAPQTKTYGVSLTLSSTVPTRTNYNFKGWATSAGGAVAYQPGGTYTANAAVTLYAVWEVAAAPLTSVSTTTIGSSGTASWTKLDNSHSYKLVLTCGGAPAVTVNVAANNSSASFTIPNTWLDYVPNSTTATATATLTTYNGSTSLGSSSKTFTVKVRSTVKPTISSFTASHYSTDGTVRSWGVFVQGFSKADLSVSATAGTGASISSIVFTGPGVNSSGTETSVRTGVIDSYGTVTFTVKVTDSRGRSATSTVSVTVHPYASPVVINIGTMRADADGTTNNSSGAYLKVLPVYSLSSVDGHNSFTAQTLSYYAHGSSTPLASISCASGTTYGPPDNLWAINIADAYDIVVSVTDALGGTATVKTTLPSASGIWYDRGNSALGLGAPPSRTNLFSCDWDVEFNGLFDVTKRRCSATLSTPGWYRVCDVMFGAESPAKGSFGFVVAFNIVRRGSSTSAESHAITYRAVNNGNGKFIGEESVGFYNNQPYVSKIRYTYDGDGNGHFDIYYELSAANNVTVFYDAYVTLGSRSAFVANSLTSVASAPAGETILTAYDFVTIGAREILCLNLSATGTVSGQGFFDYLLGVGNEIASNTDCDTLTAEGKYTCGSSSIASTLSNSPFSAAFGMFVFRVATGDRKVQIAIPNSTTITIKIRYYNGSTWTTWKTLTPT